MPEEQTTTTTEGQDAGGDNTGGDQQTTKTSEWYEKELTKTRNEAAGYRTKLRESQDKLAAAKTPEDFEKATAELKAVNAKLERDILVRDAGEGLPKELRDLLQGNTKEELAAHAEVLRKFVPKTETVDDGKDVKKTKPPRNLGGGLNGKDDVDDFDPVEIATKIRTGKL